MSQGAPGNEFPREVTFVLFKLSQDFVGRYRNAIKQAKPVMAAVFSFTCFENFV